MKSAFLHLLESSVDGSTFEDATATILRMNNGSKDDLLEGDLIIPRTRTAMKCLSTVYSCLWPKSSHGNVEIPFILSEKYDISEKREILAAFKGIESQTCIRYIPRTNQVAYLNIEPKFGCSSLLGRVGDKQTLSLQRYGCISYGIIQHELLHALGFYHEHTRSDRDKYVRINWENVHEYYVANFHKMDTDNLNIPYDYTSIMHYGRTAFGKNKAETITPTHDPAAKIGESMAISPIDVLRINKLYKCWNYL
uniref:Metalloendopeptidase n=1 Tax=Echeneis naucrates TaxID=173247 RepID=A0A665WTM6_ECHNA